LATVSSAVLNRRPFCPTVTESPANVEVTSKLAVRQVRTARILMTVFVWKIATAEERSE